MFNQTGTFPLIGRQGALCGNVQIGRDKFYATEHAVVVKPKLDWDPVFMYHMLKSLNLGRLATGAAQPGLTVSRLEEVEVVMPSITLQREFAAFVEKVDAMKEKTRALIEKLDTLYRSKLQEYFG